MADKYQTRSKKSNRKFELFGARPLAVEVPLPLVEVCEELQPEVERLTGLAGLQIIGAVIEDEVRRRVGPRHRPNGASGCVRWGQQPGYVMFSGQKVAVERPRMRTRQGQEVPLKSYARLPHNGHRQRAVREDIVAGLTSRNYRWAAQLKKLCKEKLGGLDLVAILIDGIHFGQQVLVVAVDIATSGKKHALGLWQEATENTAVVQALLEDLVARGVMGQFPISRAVSMGRRNTSLYEFTTVHHFRACGFLPYRV